MTTLHFGFPRSDHRTTSAYRCTSFKRCFSTKNHKIFTSYPYICCIMDSDPSIPNLITLPQELQLLCCSFLSPTDLAALSCCCKDLYYLCFENDLWKELYHRRWSEVVYPIDTPPESLTWKVLYKIRKDFWKGAVPVFNKNPRDGLEFFIKEGKVRRDKDDIARFLRTQPALNKVKVGHLLTSQELVDEGVLDSFMSTFQWTGAEVDLALRSLLVEIALPRSTQGIETLLDRFADKYYADNTNSLFRSSEAVYILVYSLLMLNTDLHNPLVREKMPLATFISSTRGVNSGEDFPAEYLTKLYKSILSSPLLDAAVSGMDQPGTPRKHKWMTIKTIFRSFLS